MQKFLNLAIALLTSSILSCGPQKDNVQKGAAQADTTAVKQEIQREAGKEENQFVMSYAQRTGKLIYEHYCAICHGTEGKGDGFNAYNLNPKPKDMTEKGYLSSVTNDWLIQAVSLGGRGVKRSVLMPAYENTLSKEQIKDVVAYLRYLSENN